MEETCIDRGLKKMMSREEALNKAVNNTQQKIKDTEEKVVGFIW